MSCELENVIKINQGSKESISITLFNAKTKERFDLSQFESADVIFCNSVGEKIIKSIPWPVTDPKLGVIDFELSSDDTSSFDSQMRNIEIELKYTGTTDYKIIILENVLQVTEREC